MHARSQESGCDFWSSSVFQWRAMHAPPQVGQIFIDGRASLYMLKRSTFPQKGLLSPHKRATLPQRPTYSEKGPLPPRKGPLSSQKGHFPPPPQKRSTFPTKKAHISSHKPPFEVLATGLCHTSHMSYRRYHLVVRASWCSLNMRS